MRTKNFFLLLVIYIFASPVLAGPFDLSSDDDMTPSNNEDLTKQLYDEFYKEEYKKLINLGRLQSCGFRQYTNGFWPDAWTYLLYMFDKEEVEVVSELPLEICDKVYSSPEEAYSCQANGKLYVAAYVLEEYTSAEKAFVLLDSILETYYPEINSRQRRIMVKANYILRNKYYNAVISNDQNFSFTDDELSLINQSQKICQSLNVKHIEREKENQHVVFDKKGRRTQGYVSIPRDLKLDIGTLISNSTIQGSNISISGLSVIKGVDLVAENVTLDSSRITTQVKTPGDRVQVKLKNSNLKNTQIHMNQERWRSFEDSRNQGSINDLQNYDYNGEFLINIQNSDFTNSYASVFLGYGPIKYLKNFDVKDAIFKLDCDENGCRRGDRDVVSFSDVFMRNIYNGYSLRLKGSHSVLKDIKLDSGFVDVVIRSHTKVENVNFKRRDVEIDGHIEIDYRVDIKKHTEMKNFASFISNRASVDIGARRGKLILDGKNRGYHHDGPRYGLFTGRIRINSQRDVDKYLK